MVAGRGEVVGSSSRVEGEAGWLINGMEELDEEV